MKPEWKVFWLGAALITISAISAGLAKAETNPIFLGQSQYGYHFQMASGEQWVCVTLGDDLVECVAPETGGHYNCDYRNPPEYFRNCKVINSF